MSDDPDLLGLRRSGRAKKEPVRYNAMVRVPSFSVMIPMFNLLLLHGFD